MRLERAARTGLTGSTPSSSISAVPDGCLGGTSTRMDPRHARIANLSVLQVRWYSACSLMTARLAQSAAARSPRRTCRRPGIDSVTEALQLDAQTSLTALQPSLDNTYAAIDATKAGLQTRLDALTTNLGVAPAT